MSGGTVDSSGAQERFRTLSGASRVPIDRPGPRLVLTILAIVFGAETLVMLGVLALPRLGDRAGALLDSSLLTLLIAPFLWWAVVRPLRDRALENERRAETRILHLNRVYALLSEVNQAIVRIREPQPLFEEACRIAVESGGFKMAWLGLRDERSNGVRPVAHAGLPDGYLDKLRIDPAEGPRGLGPTGSALREGRHDICNDIGRDPRMAPWRDDALARGYRASAAFPLTVKGQTVGAFNLYASEPGFFDDEEVRLLDEMAADLSFAMEMARLEDVKLRLATAIEQSPVSVAITDADGRIEYVNSAFTSVTGYTPEEALGGNPRMLKSGKQEPALYQELWATIKAGQSWHGELVNRRKDESLYTQELTIAPVRNAAGRVTHFVAISQDVTDRKRTEEALRSAEARYRLLFEESPDGVLLIDPETGRTLEANGAAHKQLGYTREEFASLRIADYEALETPEETGRHVQKVTAEGSDDFETLHRTKNGEIRNVHVWAKRIQLGERLAFHCIFEDITGRKRTEASLRSSEERYRTLFDRNLAGVYRTTFDGRILECNDAFARIFGHASRENALSGDTHALYATSADRETFVERLEAEGVVINHEFVGRRQDGGAIWLLENAHLVTGDGPGAREIIEGTLLDITERKRAEEALVASLREKEALLKEVHHRVKNNLQVITSLLRLESNRIEHPITRDVLRDMQNRIQSMAMLHETLYRSGNFAQVDLAAYLRRLASQLIRSLVTTPGQVELRLDLFSVGLDLDQAIPCGLIVNELVSNAMKHAFPAGRSGEVWVELQAVGDGDLRLRVRDSGLGLPPDFEARRGRSLGLQLVSDLARQLGGGLEIGRGPGTSFEVTFTPSHDAQFGEAPKGA